MVCSCMKKRLGSYILGDHLGGRGRWADLFRILALGPP